MGGYTRTAPITKVAQFKNVSYGIALPRHGLVVYPEVIELPWGSSADTYISVTDAAKHYNTLESGAADTLTAYNADAANRGNDCAIGYAHNFSKMVTSDGTTKGIGAGSWYIPHPSEWMMILWPVYEKLRYAASLFGYTWPDEFWTCIDSQAGSAKRFNATTGNTLTDNKTKQHGVLMIAKLPFALADH